MQTGSVEFMFISLPPFTKGVFAYKENVSLKRRSNLRRVLLPIEANKKSQKFSLVKMAENMEVYSALDKREYLVKIGDNQILHTNICCDL